MDLKDPMPLFHNAAVAALALFQSAPVAPSWLELDLPVGFTLDFGSREVVSRALNEADTLVFEGGILRATPRLGRWTRSGAERVSARVVRGAGVPVDLPLAEEGDEYLFDLDDGSWGYLRVRGVSDESVRLELARASDGSDALERDPREVTASSRSGALELYWSATEAGSEYEIWRRTLGLSSPEVSLGRVSGGQFTDDGVSAGVVVEYRVQRVGDPNAFGARVRAVVFESPPEWPIPIERGSLVDLLSGELGGDGAHVEVAYASDTHLNLRPMNGVRMTRIGQVGVGTVGAAEEWTLPDPSLDAGLYQGKLFSVQVGEDLAVLFPGGSYARLQFSTDGPGRGVVLRRQLDLEGTRLLALPPTQVDVGWSASGPSLEVSPLAADVPLADSVMLVVERELDYASDNWEECMVGAPGVRKLQVQLSEELRASAHIGRFRLRHAYPWGGHSLPGKSLRVPFGDLTDASTRATLLDAGMRDLLDDSYVRRIAARGLLVELGPQAWPRLEEALDSPDPELAGAAREILLAADASRGDHVASVLNAQAEADGVAPLPPEWLDADVDLRAWAVLRSSRRIARAHRTGLPEEVARAHADGLRVLVRAEPDEGLRRLAMLLLEQAGRPPGPAAFKSQADQLPFVLLPPAERPRTERVDWAALFASRSTTGAEVSAAIESATDLGHPKFAFVMLQMAHRWLRAVGAESGRTIAAAGDQEAVDLQERLELGLRLAQRADSTAAVTLMGAAEELVLDPATRLAALAELLDLRAGSGAVADGRRERFELAEPSLGSLMDTLEVVRSDAEGYADIVLPPGDYLPVGTEAWIDLSIDGLQLVGGEGVRFGVGLRIVNAQDVVVTGCTIDNSKGAAVTAMNASVSIFDSVLIGADTGLMVQAGRVEMFGSDIRRREEGRMSNWSVRLSGADSHLFARECVFRTGSIYPGSGTEVFIADCVLDGLDRPALQGQERSRAVVCNSLIRGEASGVLNFSDIQLEGVVLDVADKPLTLTGGEAWLCPKHVIFLDLDDPLSLPQQLAECPLERGH